jgi:hypothetical protein
MQVMACHSRFLFMSLRGHAVIGRGMQRDCLVSFGLHQASHLEVASVGVYALPLEEEVATSSLGFRLIRPAMGNL